MRLFLYHTDHGVLYDEAGWGRAFRKIATGKARMRRTEKRRVNYEQDNQKHVAGGNGRGCSLRGNGFRPAITDTGQLASCLQRHMQYHRPLQRTLPLPDIQWKYRRVRQGPGAAQTTEKIVWKSGCLGIRCSFA